MQWCPSIFVPSIYIRTSRQMLFNGIDIANFGRIIH